MQLKVFLNHQNVYVSREEDRRVNTLYWVILYVYIENLYKQINIILNIK